MTFVFVIVMGQIYFYRLRLSELRDAEIALATKINSLRRFAHLLLGAQHLINTPLPILETVMYLINNEFPLNHQRKVVVDESIAKVRRITHLLSFADLKVQWESVILPSNSEELEFEVKKIITEFSS